MRRAFTMVDVLVAVTILSILAAVGVGVSHLAMNSAKTQQTQYTIHKIDQVIRPLYASYQTRRLPDSIEAIAVRIGFVAKVTDPLPRARVPEIKLYGARELMRMEMPDRFSEFRSYGESSLMFGYALVNGRETGSALYERYYRIYQRALDHFNGDWQRLGEHAAAECLYMVVMAQPNAAEEFHESEIGDVDNDGLPEFIDGWGRPIRWLRWAPGFQSEIQSLDPVNDHDPFDPSRVDKLPAGVPPACFGCRLVPLIYSAGPDGQYDTNIVEGYDQFSNPDYGRPDPYFLSPQNTLMGEPCDDDGDGPGQHDNITNHDPAQSLGL